MPHRSKGSWPFPEASMGVSNGPRIVIIEDEPQMLRFLTTLTRSHGFEVFEATKAAEGLAAITEHAPDVVLLDLVLPDGDGLDVTRTVREWSQVPIIVLSARGLEKDKIRALDAGADDYLTKPFGAGELLARIRVALRHGADRAVSASPPRMSVGALEIDLSARRVRLGGAEVHLTPIEYQLLVTLARQPGRVLTHQQILREVWGERTTSKPHHVRVHMAQLRRKIEIDPARPRFILTELGVGYRFADDL
jgi:two-component system, OmpR family, KDP operon response regulator KdpE